MAILQNDPALPQPVDAWDDTDRLAVDTIRCLALDAVERASAPAPKLYEELGLTREAVVEAVAAMLRQPAEARVS